MADLPVDEGDEPTSRIATFPEWTRGTVNLLAASATTAYLVGRGLVGEIEDLRITGDETLAAPGLTELVTELERVATESCNRADSVLVLLDGADDEQTIEDVTRAIGQVADTAGAARRTVRRLAQLALGLSSRLAWSDAVSRAERAAVMVLHPFDAPVELLIDDGLRLFAETDDELLTELAGALCRMIVDHDCELDLRVGGAHVQLRVDGVGNLVAVVAGVPDTEARLVELGWGVDPDGFGAVSWDDPLPVLEPAQLVMRTLGVLVGEPVARRVSVAFSSSAIQRPER